MHHLENYHIKQGKCARAIHNNIYLADKMDFLYLMIVKCLHKTMKIVKNSDESVSTSSGKYETVAER